MVKIKKMIQEVYPKQSEEVYFEIYNLIKSYVRDSEKTWISEKDVMLITYGDSIKEENQKPLNTLNYFLNKYTKKTINNVHLLPMFPYSSDDGFSVIDYLEINPELGDWNDILELSKNYDLMFDAVINHISKSSEWFIKYLEEDKKYEDFFIECDPSQDYSTITRPRALPLYYEYKTKSGYKNIWATFSEDQVDLNYENPKVLIKMLDILIQYTKKGAKFIRLDAVGFLWKEIGTTSIHLRQTHTIFKIMRQVLDIVSPGTILISETNVPHQENISYFGEGDEAHLVYQFPLPPLVMHTFLSGSSYKLMKWTSSLEETKLYENTTYFNFLSSHDGVGVRPAEGILSNDEKERLVNHTLTQGGKINYKNNPDGSKEPYELNINYLNAITYNEDSINLKVQKFLAAQSILISFIGMPGIYIHSLLGSTNDYKGLKESNINRRINREKLNLSKLEEELKDDQSLRHNVFYNYLNLLEIRSNEKAFSPFSEQKALSLDDRLFSIIRENKKTNEKILVLVNVSNEKVLLTSSYQGIDIITLKKIDKKIELNPYEFLWIKLS